jgi:acetyl esterase
MPVDPQIAGLLELLAAEPPMSAGTVAEARTAFRALTFDARQPEHVVPVASVEDRTIPGPAGDLPVRIYRPNGDGVVPTVVMFHGGGWVVGDLDTHDNTARALCRDCGAVVVSVDYRLAPEAPFPAAVEDALAATRWAAGNDSLGGGPLAVAGDSAGGNLAAVVCQQLRSGPAIAAQLLIYPGVDVAGDYPSREENGVGYFLDTATMVWFLQQYATPGDFADVRLSPLLDEDLTGMPPAVVVTAEFDPLRDEGEAYAARLEQAGVPVTLRRFDGMIHGFFDMGAWSAGAQEAVDETCRLFASALRTGSPAR